ncbi:cytidylyltransferase domain-containing protein [Helicobacter burdigaliensis]|uniref:acylneuraminate cytidylyltransferase family protein n=1 Tax=Helicobacter burdigaliensis TaxID=2315334 RepID=UPI000EF7254F|nr:acylneuraminate cytidylyltransferase family protein [Helicobacter burdigaliensis]
MKIIAIMPIKLQNKRLPNKNILMLGNKPLITYNLETLKQIEELNSIYVYCSSEKIVSFLPAGIKFLQRSVELDSDNTNFTEIFEAFSGEVKADIYVYSHATAPFISIDSINKCINAVLYENHDSAFTATKIQDFLWNKNYNPLNFDAQNIPRSQDVEPIYKETSGVYVFKKEVFEKLKRRVGINPKIIEVNFKESIDINTREDFEIAKIFLNQ